MIIKVATGVLHSELVKPNLSLKLMIDDFEDDKSLEMPGAIAYLPFINSHDHLIGNWVPRAGDNRPYANSHIWVEDMKDSFSFQERNSFWENDGSFQLCTPRSLQMALLGCYKNLFSGCGVVQDHAPVQGACYYDSFPINVLEDFRQCHSLTLGNWWGGETPQKEMELSGGDVPFIIHLAEGIDDISSQEFTQLVQQGLLQKNTLIIHGIALTEEELIKIAEAGASVCWCPSSNYYLIGETLKIDLAIKNGVNVVIGTDSTMSGGVNLIAELNLIHQKHPHIPLKSLYKMITENAAKALMLPSSYARLKPDNCDNLLLVDKHDPDPFENLLLMEPSSIKLLMEDGIPRFGDVEWMERLDLDEEEYSVFRTGNKEKFVLGDPLELNDHVDEVLGYHKDFPYLPF